MMKLPLRCAWALLLVACGHDHATAIVDGSTGPDGYKLVDAKPYDAHVVPVDSGQIMQGYVDVLTQHNDVARTGQNLNETVLTTSNVNASGFGALFHVLVDGLVYAQPLIVTQYPLGDGGTHDLLIVATMHNSVYAFDANTGVPLWHAGPLGPSVPNTAIGPIINDAGDHQSTQNIQVEVGILSTPVIDKDNGIIYLTRKDYTGQVQSYKIHALSLATGQDMPGSPATITASVHGIGYDANDAGVVTMDPGFVAQRPGLLLENGVVYAAFASHEDFQPYHGWILGYSYSRGAFTQTAVWCATPDGKEGGIWNGGQGILSDGTSIYALNSNGTLSAQSGGESYGESFLRFNDSLQVEDYFSPYNWRSLNSVDDDLGSGGAVLIPGTSPLLMVGGGKSGVLYVVNTANMGKVGAMEDMNLQSIELPVDGGNGGLKAMYGSLAVWTGGATPAVYVWAAGDVVRRFPLENGLFNLDDAVGGTVANLQHEGADPNGTLSVSSNGSMSGTGIVWGCNPSSNPDHNTVTGTCYAFDANTLAVLWSTAMNPSRDGIGEFAKFVPPTIANGKVYMPTHAQKVIVYGLLGVDGG